MERYAFSLDDAVFTYFVSAEPHPLFQRQQRFSSRRLVVSHTKGTEVRSLTAGGESLCLIGLCVDSHGETERDEIPAYLLRNSHHDVRGLVGAAKRLAGQYVILYESRGGLYALGDATGSLPLFYHTGDDVCLSSCDELIGTYFQYEKSPAMISIRESADYSREMPYDVTLYGAVKALLPNHVLNIAARNAARVFAPKQKQRRKRDCEELIKGDIRLIRNIAAEYGKCYGMVCPLTGGYDSRAVYAFLKERNPGLESYTFRHPSFTEKTGDNYIPAEICALEETRHVFLKDQSAPEEYLRGLESVIGAYHSRRGIDLAYTFRSAFPGKALVNGDVIDQIGQSLIGNALPPSLAGAQFFLAKQHNYSKDAKAHTKRYVDELRESGFGEHIYDLFALECRCGRWASTRLMTYSMMGVSSLNLFNCGELIGDWISIPRKLRREKIIHQTVFAELAPELLGIPFNPDAGLKRLGGNSLTFLLATHGRWLAGWARFWIKNMRHRTPL